VIISHFCTRSHWPQRWGYFSTGRIGQWFNFYVVAPPQGNWFKYQ